MKPGAEALASLEQSIVDRHEQSRSPQNHLGSERKLKDGDRLALVVAELREKVAMLETVVEDKDSQIKAMLETLDEKEQEITELHT